ncbi:MAG: hypothetical protein ABI591_01430 [Kofleriaceae bacterium]
MIFKRRELGTAGNGTFRLVREINGYRYAGIEVATKRKVHLALGDFDVPVEELRKEFEFDVEGVAECRGVVPNDEPNPYFPGIRFVCAELMPPGKSLFDKPLPEVRRLSAIRALVHTVQRSSQQGITLLGLIPELVFVDRDVVVMPRSRTFADHRSKKYNTVDGGFVFKTAAFGDPKHLTLRVPQGDVYQLGLLIVWIYERKHAYQLAANREHDGFLLGAMRESRRDPFSGPKAIDELLEQILQPEPEDRIGIDEVVRLCMKLRDV